MKGSKPRKGTVLPKWDTDETMQKMWFHLLSDFSSSTAANIIPHWGASLLRKDMASFRTRIWPDRLDASVAVFKRDYQLENLFKRYRFRKDVYTDNELLEMGRKKFVETQIRIAEPLDISTSVFRVLQEARKIVRRILGEYNLERHQELCRFGKKASVGVPAAQAYMDERLSRPLTGSSEHIKWFKDHLSTDDLLRRSILDAQKVEDIQYEIVSELKLVFVPKSWKAYRSIMPNTTLGSFYTAGLGDYLAELLSHEGLDITRLQEKHGELARRSSVSRVRVTADLSAASDSITRELLRWLLPTRWYRVVMYGALRRVRYNGDSITMNTVITMGLGHTFPLQTLIFYSLLRAIENLSGQKQSLVSVYGDDLIYPRRIHEYVARVFPKLHLILNTEKTYVDSHFRESCGSDYYRGCDVRPFQPEGQHCLLGRHPYIAFLYKQHNGLLRRWDRSEVAGTLHYLEEEIVKVQGYIHQVPFSYPDTAGLKTTHVLRDRNYLPPVYCKEEHVWHFAYLRAMPQDRYVECLTPYLWEKLRSTQEPRSYSIYDQTVETVFWRKSNPKKYVVIRGKRRRRLVACVASKLGCAFRETSGTSSEWF